MPKNHISLPFVKCECGENLSIPRSRIRKVQDEYNVSFEVAKYVLAAGALTLQGSEIPDDFPVKVDCANGLFAFHTNFQDVKKFDKEAKTASNAAASTKKRATLRDAIKSSTDLADTKSEDDKNAEGFIGPEHQKGALKPKSKNHGKPKSIKRKTKRPGRI